MKRDHPEQRIGEMWIGNADEKSFKKMAWETKRKGKVPFNILTREPMDLVSDSLFPVFIKRKEYNDYRESKFGNDENSRGSLQERNNSPSNNRPKLRSMDKRNK